MASLTSPADRIRAVMLSAQVADYGPAVAALRDESAPVRAAALGALAQHGRLERLHVHAAFADEDPRVRRRAAEVCARLPDADVISLLHDPDALVVEAAAWAIGEGGAGVAPNAVDELIVVVETHPDAFVRETAVAALGALGDERARSAILRAMDDVVTVRRRAVLALAPFDGDDIEQAFDRALNDRDWQVRNAAADLRAGSADAASTERAAEHP